MATTAQKPVATATTTATPASVTVVSILSAEPNPKKTVTSSTDKSDPPTTASLSNAEGTVKGIEDSKTTETHLGSVAGESSGPGNDIQKKMRRAERFGVPVQLSEQEKRDSRAERFGIAPGSKGSESSKQSEEVKRKARAERFGLAVPSTAVDEEEKKKARLARFAPYAKPDTREGEKRKARAIRFSNPLSSSLAQEAPIAGKAGGSI
ncbi:modifier of snc1, 11 [Hibiscus trionum]|uniref:Modifier of snc1, 11 n=1 Tax=Hibiscus trionum TaxID=183268 RepID=A0A9W7IY58_HIBTR|nr:modifier of snc1, 11 [Hibiscus trionum]